jgi:hypothetical protein
MAKFIIGVVVGIYLGASVGAYGAIAARPETLSGWTFTKDGEEVRCGPSVATATNQIERGLSARRSPR